MRKVTILATKATLYMFPQQTACRLVGYTFRAIQRFRKLVASQFARWESFLLAPWLQPGGRSLMHRANATERATCDTNRKSDSDSPYLCRIYLPLIALKKSG